MQYVYILQCGDGSPYTGCTEDLKRDFNDTAMAVYLLPEISFWKSFYAKKVSLNLYLTEGYFLSRQEGSAVARRVRFVRQIILPPAGRCERCHQFVHDGPGNRASVCRESLSDETAILLRRKKCYGPNNYKNHRCLISAPENAHAIILIIMHQTDKYPYDGYPIY